MCAGPKAEVEVESLRERVHKLQEEATANRRRTSTSVASEAEATERRASEAEAAFAKREASFKVTESDLENIVNIHKHAYKAG